MSGINIKDMTVETSSGAVRDTLRCLFFKGPTWDGNVPSKSGRDALVKLGLAEHEFGFAWLTRAGVEMCINLGFGRQKS